MRCDVLMELMISLFLGKNTVSFPTDIPQCRLVVPFYIVRLLVSPLYDTQSKGIGSSVYSVLFFLIPVDEWWLRSYMKISRKLYFGTVCITMKLETHPIYMERNKFKLSQYFLFLRLLLKVKFFLKPFMRNFSFRVLLSKMFI